MTSTRNGMPLVFRVVAVLKKKHAHFRFGQTRKILMLTEHYKIISPCKLSCSTFDILFCSYVIGTAGSYLVRLSGSAASQDKDPGASEIRYSLAVRLPDCVQRFLITRYVSGHYVFGGRPFNL